MSEERDLLAEVLHLWVDSYISKNPNSRAPKEISDGVFVKIAKFLSKSGIEVGYEGIEATRAEALADLDKTIDELIDAEDELRAVAERPKVELPPYDEQFTVDYVAAKREIWPPQIVIEYNKAVVACRERQLLAALTEIAELKARLQK